MKLLIPDVTLTASVSPIVEIGAKPVFVDIDEKKLVYQYRSIKKNINKKTKSSFSSRLI